MLSFSLHSYSASKSSGGHNNFTGRGDMDEREISSVEGSSNSSGFSELVMNL